MKTYSEFNEAISAARLAQLAAKGKGGAAAAKMKADGLKSSATNVTKPKPKALPGSKGGALALNKPVADKGGSLVKRSSAGTQVVKKDMGKSGGLVRKTFTKPTPKSVPDEKQVGKRPGTSKGPDDWGKKTPEWEGTGGEGKKTKRKGTTLPKVKKPEIEPKKDERSPFGAEEGSAEGKQKENSQI